MHQSHACLFYAPVQISALDSHPGQWSHLNAKEASHFMAKTSVMQAKSVQFSLKQRQPGSAYHSPNLPATRTASLSPGLRKRQPAAAKHGVAYPSLEGRVLHAALDANSPRSPRFHSQSPEPRPKSYPGTQPTARPLWPSAPHLRPSTTTSSTSIKTVPVQYSSSGRSLVTEVWQSRDPDRSPDRLRDTRQSTAISAAGSQIRRDLLSSPTQHNERRHFDLLASARLQMATACLSEPASEFPTDSSSGNVYALPMNPSSSAAGVNGPFMHTSRSSPLRTPTQSGNASSPRAPSSPGLQCHGHNQTGHTHPLSLQPQFSSYLSGMFSPACTMTTALTPQSPSPLPFTHQLVSTSTAAPPPSPASMMASQTQLDADTPSLTPADNPMSVTYKFDELVDTEVTVEVGAEATFQTVHQILSTISAFSRFPAPSPRTSGGGVVTSETSPHVSLTIAPESALTVSLSIESGTRGDSATPATAAGDGLHSTQSLPDTRQTLQSFLATADALTLPEAFTLLGLQREGGDASSRSKPMAIYASDCPSVPAYQRKQGLAVSDTTTSATRAATVDLIEHPPLQQQACCDQQSFLQALQLRAVAKILGAKMQTHGAAGSKAQSLARQWRRHSLESGRCAAYALALRLGVPKARLRRFPVQVCLCEGTGGLDQGWVLQPILSGVW